MIAVLLALLAMAPSQAPRNVRVTVTVVDQTGAVIPKAKVTIPPGEAVADEREGHCDALRAGRGEGVDHRRVSRLRNADAEGRGDQGGRQQACDRPADPGVAGLGHGLARRARDGVGSQSHIRQRDDARTDRSAVGRPRRNGAAAQGHCRHQTRSSAWTASRAAGCRQSPPIKAIHITRDAFAAENHYAGGLFVDIITQPGIGPLRTGMNFRLRDGSLERKAAVQHRQQRHQGSRADAELRTQLRRIADQEPGLVFAQPERRHLVRHAVLLLLPSRRQPGEYAGATPSPRQHVRLRSVRLRHHARPDAPRALQPGQLHEQEPRASAATRCSSAPTRRTRPTITSRSRKPARSAAGSSSTPAR